MKPLHAFVKILEIFVRSEDGFTEEELQRCHELMCASGYDGGPLTGAEMMPTIYYGLVSMLASTIKTEEEVGGDADILHRIMGTILDPQDLIAALQYTGAEGTMIKLDPDDPATEEILKTIDGMAQDQEMDRRAEHLKGGRR